MRESSLWSALGDPARRALVDLRLVEPAPARVLARVPDHTTSRLEAPPCCASPVLVAQHRLGRERWCEFRARCGAIQTSMN